MSWLPMSAQAAEAGIAGAEIPPGTGANLTAEDLDVMTWDLHQLDVDLAAELGFSLGDVSASRQSRTLVAEWARSKTIEDGASKSRWGVAARLVVTVTGLEGEANLNLPMVAAKAQVNQVETRASLRVEGYTNPSAGKLLPEFSNFDVETYVVLKDALTKLKDGIADDPEHIRPVQLWHWAPDEADDSLSEAVAKAWALTRIRRGDSLERTRDGYRDQDDAQALRAIEAVYAGFAEDGGGISETARARAKGLLDGYELHRPRGRDI